ncbi:hypothetical protein Q0Z83_087050 [Actinoplanes sichuanensis]|uniref:Uncharacterized protein n=1 Tax=Actinoplanes sichuanensis TaxID=512349 RepID=A0ABW4A461_9ACTN|nr:hypothetical protein [Actinoplanes sichuanensis]BEL10514.1 hypothetical protein Q0Z83_087050 [Actinoplanes sichuanensis]
MTYPMNEIDLETPEVDAAEQATTVPGWQDDADEQESAEQDRIVEFDDDYR